MIYDVICENHLVIFYPLPYFELEGVNRGVQSMSDIVMNANKF